MVKKLIVLAISAATITACASPSVSTTDTYRQTGLNGTAVSQGACDSVGQLLPGARLPQGQLTVSPRSNGTLEASAAPTHD